MVYLCLVETATKKKEGCHQYFQGQSKIQARGQDGGDRRPVLQVERPGCDPRHSQNKPSSPCDPRSGSNRKALGLRTSTEVLTGITSPLSCPLKMDSSQAATVPIRILYPERGRVVLVLKCVLAASHPLESHWSRRGLGNTFLIHCQEVSQCASLKFLYVQVSISAAYMAFLFFFFKHKELFLRKCFLG